MRHAARTQPGISNEIDWDNVAEEIEGVGRSEFAAVRSFIRLILVHVIKAVSLPAESSSILHWQREVVSVHRELLDHATPSMLVRLDIDALWQQARKQAAADLAVHDQRVEGSLPQRCPFGIELIIDPDFDFVATVASLRKGIAPQPARHDRIP